MLKTIGVLFLWSPLYVLYVYSRSFHNQQQYFVWKVLVLREDYIFFLSVCIIQLLTSEEFYIISESNGISIIVAKVMRMKIKSFIKMSPLWFGRNDSAFVVPCPISDTFTPLRMEHVPNGRPLGYNSNGSY